MTGEVNLKSKKTKVKAPRPEKKRRAKSLDRRKARAGWFFVLPFVLMFVAIYVPIVFNSINLSFHDQVILQGGTYDLDYVGWDNYNNALFVNPDFVETLVGGIKQLLFDIPAIVLFSLFMAILLNQKMAGRTLFRAIFFIPVILSTGIIEEIDANNALMQFMEGSGGVSMGGEEASNAANNIISSMDIQKLFENMQIGQGLVDYVVGIVNDIYNIVNRSGVQMLIFLAGLQSISPAIYESCTMEGATAWETFWKITFPMISPMILVNSIYTVIDSFTSRSNSVMVLIGEVYDGGSQEIATAMSWMYFLLVLVILSLVALLISSYVFYQRRD